MLPAEIRAAIAGDVALQALVPNAQAIADALSAGRKRPRFLLATERTVVATLGVVAGEAFLSALEAFAVATLSAEHPMLPYQAGIARQLAWLKRDGLDVGDANTRAMMDALVTAGVLDAASVAAIKALGDESDAVSEYDVRRALYNDDGTLAV